MIGLVIATHGKMSDGIVDAANLIMGETENVETLNLMHGDNIEEFNQQMVEAIKKVDQQEGVIVFTDLFGASPYNQATLAVRSLPEEARKRTFVVTGVNLPMVIVAANQRMMGSSVDEVVETVLEESKQSLVVWTATEEQVGAAEDEDDDF